MPEWPGKYIVVHLPKVVTIASIIWA